MNMNGNMMVEQVKAEILIRVLVTGKVEITGPLKDKMFMYGILECAKDIVRMQTPEEPSRIAAVTMAPRFQH